MMRALVRLISAIAILFFTSLGVFGAMGLCVAIWGPSILTTVLSNPPDRTHPAFITFILLMIPSMLIGAVGGLAAVVVPLYSRFPVAGVSERAILRHYRTLLSKVIGD
jgi:hypothetical protein